MAARGLARVSGVWRGALVLAAAAAACGRDTPETVTRATSAPAPLLVEATPAQVLRAVRSGGGRAVLVNVWASWCVPCREEMPDILRIYRERRDAGLRLVLVSGDFEAEPARRFLAGQGVDFPSFLKAGDDMELINALSPRWSGALPASFLFDGNGTLRHFWEGKATYGDFAARVDGVLRTAPGAEEEGT